MNSTRNDEQPGPALAGFSKVDITPLLDRMEVFGLGYWYQRSVRFRGIRDPLFARALVLGDGNDCQVIVSVDAILDTFGFIPRAREAVSQRLGIPPGHVLVTCTHTHSAPLIVFNRTDRGAEYGPYVAHGIITAVLQAFGARTPVTATVSRDRVAGVVRNRRPLLRNGQIAELHAPLDPADVVDPGPVNDTMTLVRFRRSSGTLAGAICHFGIHGVSLQCSDLISSDCMGRAIQQVETEIAGDAVMLHLNAPCADIDPVAMGSEAALNEMTGRLYAGIRKISALPERSVRLAPRKCSEAVFRAIRRRTRTEQELLEAHTRLAADGKLSHHSGAGYERFLIEEERALGEMPAGFNIPYQIFRAGDLLWVGVGGEVFTRFGQQLASADDRFDILPVGIAGASAGYLPAAEMFSQGGYEVALARWCRVAPGETEKLFWQIERDVQLATGAPAR